MRPQRALFVALAGLLAASGFPAVNARMPAIGLHAGRDDSLTQYEDFGDWLGRKVMYRVVFSDRSSWQDIASPWYLGASANWVQSDPRRVEVISLPLLPVGEEGNFAAVTTGGKDAVFRTFAEKVHAKGIADQVIVRLAWEGNGDWYPWSYAADPAGFRAAFRRAVQVMRKAAPALRFEWCISFCANRRGGPAEWTEGYPGDDVVDIISMDIYDEYNSGWDWLLNHEAGLKALREFAIAHDKPEAYSEWACSTNTSAEGGGDDPEFVANMADWFRGRPGGVLYQAYWNTSAGGPNGAILKLDSTTLIPKAAAAYKKLFGPVPAPSDPRLR